MSQVHFMTEFRGQRALVISGWDRPLQHFHLSIYDPGVDTEDDVLWEGLFQLPRGGLSSAEAVKQKLLELGIQPPEGFVEICDRREGNVKYVAMNGDWSRSEG